MLFTRPVGSTIAEWRVFDALLRNRSVGSCNFSVNALATPLPGTFHVAYTRSVPGAPGGDLSYRVGVLDLLSCQPVVEQELNRSAREACGHEPPGGPVLAASMLDGDVAVHCLDTYGPLHNGPPEWKVAKILDGAVLGLREHFPGVAPALDIHPAVALATSFPFVAASLPVVSVGPKCLVIAALDAQFPLVTTFIKGEYITSKVADFVEIPNLDVDNTVLEGAFDISDAERGRVAILARAPESWWLVIFTCADGVSQRVHRIARVADEVPVKVFRSGEPGALWFQWKAAGAGASAPVTIRKMKVALAVG